MDFTDKVIVVTGGSRGIGRAMVEHFRSLKARVYFSYYTHEQEAAETGARTGAVAIAVSQRDEQAIQSAVDMVRKNAGRLDVLINNAGMVSDQFCMLMPKEQWSEVLDVNLSGAFFWSKAALRPMMEARSGAIVFISSVAAQIGIRGQANYAASKGGLLAFMRSLAAEAAGFGIRVNAVVPGYVETAMTQKMDRDFKHRQKQRILLNRFGTPLEVATAAAFLASDEASYIIGQSLVVDGGLTAAVA